MTVSLPALAALAALLTAAAPQKADAYARAIARCESDYVKRTTACRRAVGNYLCLQATLDRFSDCRQKAARLMPPPPPAVVLERAGTIAPAR